MIAPLPARFSRTFPLAQYMREASAGRLMIACRQAGTFLSRRAAGRVRRAGARRARRGRFPRGSGPDLSAAGASVNRMTDHTNLSATVQKPSATVIDWLLDSDPAIRWQVLAD